MLAEPLFLGSGAGPSRHWVKDCSFEDEVNNTTKEGLVMRRTLFWKALFSWSDLDTLLATFPMFLSPSLRTLFCTVL